ncbi:tripartite tricarboxylate transporter TctB family protein [Brevibacillus fulvus]|uniref:ABC-type multidrug transport system permease subunit n=1 Tax=Brevibacillus fulvus TaxID=1125967 RepID=A0A939BV36_9BACL|nr:tripartite tricarboxylate transporter TctB family protein [Brevibacillus fulvus]MBM7590251.1 ABC-type multidrug transport system permease subunit [Brevibacillus fulvus]
MKAGKTVSVLLIALSLAVVVLAYNIEDQNMFDPSSASFFPGLVGAIMLISALLIAWRGRQSPSPVPEAPKAERSGEKADEEVEDLYEKEAITQKEINIRLLLFTGLVVLFAILMNYFNFMLLSFLFLFAAMLLLSRQKMFRSFVVSAVMSIACYYIFAHVFHIVFPS